ncbi:uncharacterized protein BDZ83DRAFT_356004 [Colletotrichum acutatum]|uniref:Uncharacterized protein n=1 Tax=Glomerella acutata TaxID=27357 RepID=A0AAD8UK94_GLOAC|nr:uncharacterized protein BDZ83DRAFT_356004 [Colletotrichum acutatum]KAK1724327.1 hypothetical protein BDZ83DRAFT_356004 [Colletotrichum acutatum]
MYLFCLDGYRTLLAISCLLLLPIPINPTVNASPSLSFSNTPDSHKTDILTSSIFLLRLLPASSTLSRSTANPFLDTLRHIRLISPPNQRDIHIAARHQSPAAVRTSSPTSFLVPTTQHNTAIPTRVTISLPRSLIASFLVLPNTNFERPSTVLTNSTTKPRPIPFVSFDQHSPPEFESVKTSRRQSPKPRAKGTRLYRIVYSTVLDNRRTCGLIAFRTHLSEHTTTGLPWGFAALLLLTDCRLRHSASSILHTHCRLRRVNSIPVTKTLLASPILS